MNESHNSDNAPKLTNMSNCSRLITRKIRLIIKNYSSANHSLTHLFERFLLQRKIILSWSMDSSFDHHRAIWVQVRDREVLGLICPSWSVIFIILLDRSEILIFFGPVPVLVRESLVPICISACI